MFFRMVYKSGPIFLPFCHNPRVWQTDRQTDWRTDRNLITIPRLHYMQGKDDVFSHVARKNDKLRDVFLEERAFFGRFRSQETVWSQRVTGTVGIACCRCLTKEKWYTEGALCHVVGCFLDKKRRVQDTLRYEGVC